MSKLYDEIMQQSCNRDRVKMFIELGLNPKYGLSAEMTMFMVDIYVEVSGDTSLSGKYNCGACQDTIFRKLQDFLHYGDNVGKPLINWEPVETPKVKVKKSKSNNADNA